jgi:hypothetical protein
MRRETSTVDSTIKGARCAGVGRVTVQRLIATFLAWATLRESALSFALNRSVQCEAEADPGFALPAGPRASAHARRCFKRKNRRFWRAHFCCTVARPKRFELLTPRFAVWSSC